MVLPCTDSLEVTIKLIAELNHALLGLVRQRVKFPHRAISNQMVTASLQIP